MSFMGVEFVVVNVVVGAGGLVKSAYSLKTKSLQLCLLWLARSKSDMFEVIWAVKRYGCFSPNARCRCIRGYRARHDASGSSSLMLGFYPCSHCIEPLNGFEK